MRLKRLTGVVLVTFAALNGDYHLSFGFALGILIS